jgi:hypothetical protein
MSGSFSPLRKAVVSISVVVASFAFVAGGATAAHAEMDPWETPPQADVDWTPGTGWSTGPTPNYTWWPGNYILNSFDIFGYDIYTLKSGYGASMSDAYGMQQWGGYKSCGVGRSGEIVCSIN